ncbi:helix-turn-helix transcriptional regulator [Bacillus sp. CGMCC 1.16607]|uniref:helix-turn-helix transcriptional regulator n=1 Tax=Bacillus sp. CGMCC 1.16607 TaxID=3351842 RepID=UPI003630E3A9
MSNLHRIIWFDDQVRMKRYPNSKNIVQKFEISSRQALRDIEYLVNTMGAPLQYVPQKRGYEYIEDTYILPYQIITEEEQKILSFLAHRYGQFSYENSSSINRLASLFKRLGGKQVSVTDSYPFFSVHNFLIDLIHKIDFAITEKKYIHVTYYSHDCQSHVTKHLEPITLLYKGSSDFLVSYSPEDQEEVLTELKDISEMTISDKTTNLVINSKKHSLTKVPFEAKVEFLFPFEGNSWLGYNIKWIEKKAFTIEFYDVESFLDQLLGSSNTIKLIGPEWLKDKLFEKCRTILQG